MSVFMLFLVLGSRFFREVGKFVTDYEV